MVRNKDSIKIKYIKYITQFTFILVIYSNLYLRVKLKVYYFGILLYFLFILEKNKKLNICVLVLREIYK